MGANCTKNRFRASDFEDYMKQTHLFRLLVQEHQKISEEKIRFDCSVSLQSKNLLKNRFWFLPCFDHNRVLLPADNGENDFINASRVDGHKTKDKYLCCQGPLPSTAEDFWKMVFAYQSRVIVMLTETTNGACYQYWSPKKGTTVFYGDFTVETIKVENFCDHVVTSLRVTVDSDDPLELQHFAYTDWPHKRLPRNPSDFLNFVLKVRKAQNEAVDDCKSDNYPSMVVHCSAGLNRSGTYCALDISISRYNESATIDLAAVVRKLRAQRSNCLSLASHYVFCYFVILEYVKIVADMP